MVKLIPFKGLRYNNKAINLENVVAPPYDVITKEQQSEYYNKTEFNVIRLILGKSHADDTSNNNRYTRASSYLEKWLMNGVLIQDGEPSIYVYEGEYQFQNETKIYSLKNEMIHPERSLNNIVNGTSEDIQSILVSFYNKKRKRKSELTSNN